jgi:hypothetical protein
MYEDITDITHILIWIRGVVVSIAGEMHTSQVQIPVPSILGCPWMNHPRAEPPWWDLSLATTGCLPPVAANDRQWLSVAASGHQWFVHVGLLFGCWVVVSQLLQTLLWITKGALHTQCCILQMQRCVVRTCHFVHGCLRHSFSCYPELLPIRVQCSCTFHHSSLRTNKQHKIIITGTYNNMQGSI